jgi:hypothetical protein
MTITPYGWSFSQLFVEDSRIVEASDNARDKEGYQHAPKHDKAQTGRGRCKGEEEEDIGESLGSRPRATDSRRERERESLSHKACRAVEALRAVVAI